MTPRPEVATARDAIAAKPSTAPTRVDALRGVVPDELLRPLGAAVDALWNGAPTPLEVAPLLAIARDPSRYLRAALAIVLSRFDDDGARAALLAATDDPDPMVRQAAVRALGARARLTRELLHKALTDPEPKVRQAARCARWPGARRGNIPRPIRRSWPRPCAASATPASTPPSTPTPGSRPLTEIERLMLLRQVPMFADLAPDDLDEVAAVVVEQHLQIGQDVCKEGDVGDAVFLLVKGKVRVFTGGGDRPERTLSELGPGACIGEMAVFDAAPRSATVRAVERTRLLVVPGAEFKALLVERPRDLDRDHRRAGPAHAWPHGRMNVELRRFAAYDPTDEPSSRSHQDHLEDRRVRRRHARHRGLRRQGQAGHHRHHRRGPARSADRRPVRGDRSEPDRQPVRRG
jgi:CRP/FNR family cyclic AMP-dependent transcriptional regulator